MSVVFFPLSGSFVFLSATLPLFQSQSFSFPAFVGGAFGHLRLLSWQCIFRQGPVRELVFLSTTASSLSTLFSKHFRSEEKIFPSRSFTTVPTHWIRRDFFPFP